jgi:hypothetical protein
LKNCQDAPTARRLIILIDLTGPKIVDVGHNRIHVYRAAHVPILGNFAASACRFHEPILIEFWARANRRIRYRSTAPVAICVDPSELKSIIHDRVVVRLPVADSVTTMPKVKVVAELVRDCPGDIAR